MCLITITKVDILDDLTRVKLHCVRTILAPSKMDDRDSYVIHACIIASPGHGVNIVVPCIVQIHGLRWFIIPHTYHAMTCYRYHDRSPCIDLCHIVVKGETSRGKRIYLLRVILFHSVTAGFGKQTQSMAECRCWQSQACRRDKIVKPS